MKVYKWCIGFFLLVLSTKSIGVELPQIEENIFGKLEVYELNGANILRLKKDGSTEAMISFSKDRTFFRITAKNMHITIDKLGDNLYQVKNILTGQGSIVSNMTGPIVEPTIQDTLNQLNNFQSYEWANSAYNFMLLEAEEKSAFNMKMSSPPKSNAELCEQSDCGIMDGVGLLGTAVLAGATCAESLGLACGGSAAVLAWGVSEFEEECGACIRDRFDGKTFEERYPPRPTQPGYEHICDLFYPNCYVERDPFPDDECDNVVDINCDSDDPEDPNDM